MHCKRGQRKVARPSLKTLHPDRCSRTIRRVVTLCRSTIATALAIAISGCTVGPDFLPPLAPVAPKFIGANNRWITSAYQDYPDWWTSFHDPTLNRLIDLAYNQNLTLLSAGTRVLQARAVLGIAVGSFYPQVQQSTGSLLFNR